MLWVRGSPQQLVSLALMEGGGEHGNENVLQDLEREREGESEGGRRKRGGREGGRGEEIENN